MLKRFIVIVLAVVISLMFTFAAASAVLDEPDAEVAASSLNALGLFNGVGIKPDGSPDFALDRAPTRAEAVTMLVRLVGKEAEAKEAPRPVPFNDVPEWAKPYVGYAFENLHVRGVGNVTFASGRAVTASEYITFILNALGYIPGTDFEWNKAWVLSDELGITDGRYNAATVKFDRGDIAVISLRALETMLKDSEKTLCSLLIDANVCSEAAANTAGIGVISDTPVPMAERMPTPTPVQTPAPGVSQLEMEVFSLINKTRVDYGLATLEWSSILADVARAHSTDMGQRSFFSHINPDGLRPMQRMFAAGLSLRYSAENIARGYRTSGAVVAAWMASPSHRAAILAEEPSVMGVGLYNDYWTANFVGF